jgi:hypothetical protein
LGISSAIRGGFLLGAGMFLCSGCGGNESELGMPLVAITSTLSGEATAPSGELPPFPGEYPTDVSFDRQASASDLTIPGNAYLFQHGSANRAGEGSPLGWIIAPGGDDDLAYAEYAVSGFTELRPTDLSINTMGVIAPGGDDDLPLNYWIGLSDYTSYIWEWRGPYTGPIELILNSEEIRQRYVSEAGVLTFVVLSDASLVPISANNPTGTAAVEVVTATIDGLLATDVQYQPTLPYCPWIQDLSLGDLKGGSALDPATQHVSLQWPHVIDLANPENEAVYYQVFRRLVGAPMEDVVLLNTIPAPGLQFVDPTDGNPLAEKLIPGERSTSAGQLLSQRHGPSLCLCWPRVNSMPAMEAPATQSYCSGTSLKAPAVTTSIATTRTTCWQPWAMSANGSMRASLTTTPTSIGSSPSTNMG